MEKESNKFEKLYVDALDRIISSNTREYAFQVENLIKFTLSHIMSKEGQLSKFYDTFANKYGQAYDIYYLLNDEGLRLELDYSANIKSLTFNNDGLINIDLLNEILSKDNVSVSLFSKDIYNKDKYIKTTSKVTVDYSRKPKKEINFQKGLDK